MCDYNCTPLDEDELTTTYILFGSFINYLAIFNQILQLDLGNTLSR